MEDQEGIEFYPPLWSRIKVDKTVCSRSYSSCPHSLLPIPFGTYLESMTSWWIRLGAFIAPNKYVPVFPPPLPNYDSRSFNPKYMSTRGGAIIMLSLPHHHMRDVASFDMYWLVVHVDHISYSIQKKVNWRILQLRSNQPMSTSRFTSSFLVIYHPHFVYIVRPLDLYHLASNAQIRAERSGPFADD